MTSVGVLTEEEDAEGEESILFHLKSREMYRKAGEVERNV